jgi:hypothetical protein
MEYLGHDVFISEGAKILDEKQYVHKNIRKHGELTSRS